MSSTRSLAMLVSTLRRAALPYAIHCSAMILWPGPVANGQGLRGRVVSADSTAPVSGVVVVLEDSLRKEVARTLSSPTGSFVLRAKGAGAYRIRTLRIGFRPGEFGPYSLSARTDHDVLLALRDIPTSLTAVRVVASSECRARDDGSDATLAIWEEARKALLLTVLARTDRQPAVVMSNYERVIDPRSGRVLRQTVQRRTGVSTRPYVSPLAPDEYAVRGYEERDAAGTTYRAPDADVLLADSFAAVHCFQVVESPGDAGIIGLAFHPAARRPEVVDVAGTLWLDRTTSELRRLEFQYVGLDPQLADAGGQMSFVMMPTGIWMISQWQISVPRVAASRGFEPTAGGSLADQGSLSTRPVTRRRVVEVWQFGGQLSSVRVDSQVVWRGRTARLEGIVRDAESGMAVPGAGVSLRGTEYTTRTDDAGRFVLVDVLPAQYQVEAKSPAVASLGLDSGVDESVDLREPGTVTVTLRTPSLRSALTRACAGSDRSGSAGASGVVQGVVRNAEDGTPLAGATVLARWLGRVDLRGSGVAGVSAQELQATTTTGPGGGFLFCSVDASRPIRLLATRDSLQSQTVIVRLSDTTLVASVDLPVARMTRAAAVLEEVVVRDSAASAFDRRRRTAHGAFLTESDIERRQATRTDQLLRTIPGLRLEARAGAGVVIVADRGARSIEKGTGKTDRCDGVQVLIDGAAVAQPFDPNQIPPVSIRSLEFYQGEATTPPELRTSKAVCGTLAIWTK